MLGSRIEKSQSEDIQIYPDGENNLRAPSFARLIKLNFLDMHLILKKIGHLTSDHKKIIKKKYCDFFTSL